MPKRSTTARNSAQRKQRAQKSIEFVRPVAVSEKQEPPQESTNESAAAPEEIKDQKTAREEEQEKEISPVSTAPKGSAAARLAARRNAAQRTQRSTASLITAEHFAYVRKDLVTIGILAVVMLVIIITLYFVLSATVI